MSVDLAWIALGSNIGDRGAALDEALGHLRGAMVIEASSSRWETAPVGDVDQATFLNMVVRVETKRSPQELLSLCLGIESQMGRDRRTQHAGGPRRIDLDLLLMRGCPTLEVPGLTMPHPRLHDRAFVLAPLVELNADLHHPALGRSMGALLDDEIDRHGPLAGRCDRVA